MLKSKKTLQLLLVGGLLSGCATPLLESPRPMEPGEVQVGLYTDMIMSYTGGFTPIPTGIMLKAGITKNTSISLRASVYGAGMDVKRSFGKRAIAFGFNTFAAGFMFSDTSDFSAGWTWIHTTWIMESKRTFHSYNAYFLAGPYAFLPARNMTKPVPWGIRAAIGISSKDISLTNTISVVLEYGFLLPINNEENLFEEYYGDIFIIPYRAIGLFLSF